MRIFKVRAFDRWAAKEGLTDDMLRAVIREMERGQTGVNLGGHVYKKRVALGSRGKSAGARTFIVYRVADTAFFADGFTKSDRLNIGNKELKALKNLASTLLGYSSRDIDHFKDAGELIEVDDNEQIDT